MLFLFSYFDRSEVSYHQPEVVTKTFHHEYMNLEDDDKFQNIVHFGQSSLVVPFYGWLKAKAETLILNQSFSVYFVPPRPKKTIIWFGCLEL